MLAVNMDWESIVRCELTHTNAEMRTDMKPICRMQEGERGVGTLRP